MTIDYKSLRNLATLSPSAENTVEIFAQGREAGQDINEVFKSMADVFKVMPLGTISVAPTRNNRSGSDLNKAQNTRITTLPEFWNRIYEFGSGEMNRNEIENSDAGRLPIWQQRYWALRNIANSFNYFNPRNDAYDYNNDGVKTPIDNDGDGTANTSKELAVYGRININTAPWFVIAQLPWVADLAAVNDASLSNENAILARYMLARAITAYRDKQAVKSGSEMLINYGQPENDGTLWSDWCYNEGNLTWTPYADQAEWDTLSNTEKQANTEIMARINATRQYMLNVPAREWDRNFNEAHGFRSVAELMNVTYDLNMLQSNEDGGNARHNLRIGAGGENNRPIDKVREFGRIDRYGEINNSDLDDPVVIANGIASHPFYDEMSALTDDYKRSILFKRLSNLVTVRSDVFTAYILVRLGEAGPQKRYIAIFDRSNCFRPDDRPRLITLYQVPDTY